MILGLNSQAVCPYIVVQISDLNRKIHLTDATCSKINLVFLEQQPMSLKLKLTYLACQTIVMLSLQPNLSVFW